MNEHERISNSQRSDQGNAPTRQDKGRSDKANPSSKSSLLNLPFLLAVASVLVILLSPIAYRMQFSDRIFPGVFVSDVDLGGMSIEEAKAALEKAGMVEDRTIRVTAGEEAWTLDTGRKGGASGISFDQRASLLEAWEVGRSEGAFSNLSQMLKARFQGHRVEPFVGIDLGIAEDTLLRVADSYDRPAKNASVTLEGTKVSPEDAVEGRYIKVSDALQKLERFAEQKQWPIPDFELPNERIEPEVLDASAAISQAEALLKSPLVLRADTEAWTLEPSQLAPMLTTEADGGSVHIRLDAERLERWLQPISEVISRTAEMPRFGFDSESSRLQLMDRGVKGQSILVEETASRILEAGRRDIRTVRIALHSNPPAVADTVSASSLGIKELVAESTSHYRGSSPGRIHNIGLAAERFDGLLIPPDSVFSFNQYVGDISLEEGYKETLIIVDGATADGVGGGVCQVSTTLFRSAFWAGLPFEERHAHGYRVAYYEQQAPVGFDATIFSPIVDLKFRNDTGQWLLIEAKTNPAARTATFRLYGTKPERTVEMGDIIRGKSVPPPAERVEVDPSLPPGASEVVEYAREGLSVTIQRIITEEGEERMDQFHSTYRPTGRVVAVGVDPDAPPEDEERIVDSALP